MSFFEQLLDPFRAHTRARTRTFYKSASLGQTAMASPPSPRPPPLLYYDPPDPIHNVHRLKALPVIPKKLKVKNMYLY